MNREDGAKLQIAFHEWGLSPHFDGLQAAKYAKEALMASRPDLWGLGLWTDGRTYFLLDSKGFITSTEDGALALRLVSFESQKGPGALRALLARPSLGPTAGIRVVPSAYRPKDPVPAVKDDSSQKPLRRRRLSEAEFAKLLEGL